MDKYIYFPGLHGRRERQGDLPAVRDGEGSRAEAQRIQVHHHDRPWL